MNKDEALSEAIKRAARERDRLRDPRWEELAQGTLAEKDVAELRGLAEQSEDARDAFALFSPIDEAKAEAMTASLLARGAGSKPGPLEPDKARSPSPVAPLRRRGLVALLAAASLAAVIYVALVPRQPSSALPLYEAVVTRGDAAMMGSADGPDGVRRLSAGGRLDVTLRPATRVNAPVAAKAFLVRDGRASALSLSPEIETSGVVHFRVTRESLPSDAPPGRYVIVFVVGPAEGGSGSALPTEDSVLALAEQEAGAPLGQPLRVNRVRILLADGPAN